MQVPRLRPQRTRHACSGVRENRAHRLGEGVAVANRDFSRILDPHGMTAAGTAGETKRKVGLFQEVERIVGHGEESISAWVEQRL